VDDGTVGKYGAEVRLRRELEKTINQQRIHASKGIHKFVIVEIIQGCISS
jgi:transient receptor potential cation channel subfamily M protein 7